MIPSRQTLRRVNGRAPSDLDVAGVDLILHLMSAVEVIRNSVYTRLHKEAGLSEGKFSLMMSLRDAGHPVSTGRLAAHLGVSDATVSVMVKRMLAEIRSYGVGLIIADQSPRKVTTDVVALTDIKVAFRLVEAEDKRILGDSINMTSAQLDRLGGLHPGEAFLFFNRLEAPEEVVTPNYRLENNIDITLSDEGIRELSTYWRGREGRLRPYPECRLCACCQKTCDYERRVIARDVARRIFVRHFTAKDKTFEPLKGVLRHISALVRAELNNEPFTYELLLCTKVHLWRRVRYETHIPITDRQIKNSLSK